MATRTSTTSGLFSVGATWVGGVAPVDGDAFVIAAGHSVEFDQDMSGYATGMLASTINGTLFFSRTAGTYYLKLGANLTIGSTGTVDASDGAGGSYPSNCKATIFLNGNFNCNYTTGSVINLRCLDAVIKYVKLSGTEAIGSTVLDVDTDVTTDALWANGALIRIDDVNQAAESEERTISGAPSSTQITITVGLTAAKAAGSYVTLVSRNVQILGTAAGLGSAVNSVTGGTL